MDAEDWGLHYAAESSRRRTPRLYASEVLIFQSYLVFISLLAIHIAQCLTLYPFRSLNTMSIPTVALVQGSAFGGGVGLVSCCDIAIAVQSAFFTLSEVKLGLLPAVISPYVVARIGPQQARRYFLTAERIAAARAQEIGLLHEVVADATELEAWGAKLKGIFAENSPSGMAASKNIIGVVAGKPIDDSIIAVTASALAHQRASVEGLEGLAAFFGKRKPSWCPQ